MALNNLQNIEQLATESIDNIYAETVDDAIQKLYNRYDIVKENDNYTYKQEGVLMPGGNLPDIYTNTNQYQDFYSSSINKGIHASYIKGATQRFGQSRSDYQFGTEFLRNGYTSFSGADISVTALFKGGAAVVLGELQTLSYSIFTPTVPVYALGTKKPSGFVKGPRTIAGTLIFTVFDRHALISAMHHAYAGVVSAKCLDRDYISDELPPFDLQVMFLNEYGQSSGLMIYDVRITSEGQTMSIEDMITENTMQYMASDIQLMRHDYVQEPY